MFKEESKSRWPKSRRKEERGEEGGVEKGVQRPVLQSLWTGKAGFSREVGATGGFEQGTD